MGKRQRKVAYVVLSGHKPGVYTSWDEVEKQVKGFSNAYQRGFTEADGGMKEAVTQYKRHCDTLKNASNGDARGFHAENTRNFHSIGQAQAATTEILPLHRPGVSGGKRRNSQPAADETPPKSPRLVRKVDPYISPDNVPTSKQTRQQSPNSGSSPIKKFADYNGIDTMKTDNASGTPQVSTSFSNPDHSVLDDFDTESDRRDIFQNSNSAPHYIPLDEFVDGDEYADTSLNKTIDTHTFITQNADRPLCQEQRDLVELILSGKNVFYTGSAGCGKSEVLKCFRRCLNEQGKRVRTLAPTGKAALEVHGSTTWSYVGWKPESMNKPIQELKHRAVKNKFVKRSLRRTDVLVIDEISMVENHFFERLNRVMKSVRSSSEAFGGVQIIVTGDFCQLPPVKPFKYCIECGSELKKAGSKVMRCVTHGDFQTQNMWAFCSDAWQECNFVHRNLTTIHRQSDPKFINILEKGRLRKTLSAEDQKLLLNHKSDTEGAVKLFPKKEQVAEVNQERFASLSTPIIEFTCLDHLEPEEKHFIPESMEKILPDGSLKALEHHRYEPQVQLRVGMLVVLLANLNINEGLVNGSQGTIIGFEAHKRQQLPEQKGDYSEHKSALMNAFINKSEVKEWPVVRFMNGRKFTVYADCSINEWGDSKPYCLLSRTQIPLMAAWAMTVHKSQGMTLSRVIVDLAESFEEGQEYVALSRATGLEGLKVERLSAQRSRPPNPQVKQFLGQNFGLIMGD